MMISKIVDMNPILRLQSLHSMIKKKILDSQEDLEMGISKLILSQRQFLQVQKRRKKMCLAEIHLEMMMVSELMGLGAVQDLMHNGEMILERKKRNHIKVLTSLPITLKI
jgi:hypothetical protein